MKKRLYISIIIVLIILISFIFGVYTYYTKKSVSYSYTITIKPSSSEENYALLVPIPLNYKGNILSQPENTTTISKIIDGLHFEKGSGSFKIKETQYGRALEIIGKGNIKLVSSGNTKPDDMNIEGNWPHVTFSLRAGYKENVEWDKRGFYHWIYSNMSPIKINIELYVQYDAYGVNAYSRLYSKLNGTLLNGWQEIKLTQWGSMV